MGRISKSSIIKLKLTRENWHSTAFLRLSEPNAYTKLLAEKYLHKSEYEIFDGFEYEARKKSFLQGRYVAKKALSHFLEEPDLTKIIVKSGVFNQPMLNYPIAEPPGFSISHSLSGTCCLVFPQEHPMGIDIQSKVDYAIEAIDSQLTDEEKMLSRRSDMRDDIFYIKLWTIKEALSKVLTTGLTSPMEIYEIDNISKKDEFYYSTFKNFTQYKAISFIWAGNVCSFVLPLKTKCDLDELINYINH